MIHEFWFLKRNRTFIYLAFLLLGISHNHHSFAQEKTATTQESNTVTIDQLLALLDVGDDITNKTLVMNEVNFDFGKLTLTEEAKLYLNKVVRLLMAIDNMNLVISGHTDNVGDPSTNLKLSKERALSVYYYLIENGISATRLSHDGYGDTRPVASNRTDVGQQKNRRVEFGITQDQAVAQNAQMQDVIYLTNGTKIGAYNVSPKGDKLYYTLFSDGASHSVAITEVSSIQYSNGKSYTKTRSTEPIPPKKDDPWVTRNEEGTFLYRLRYLDGYAGINFARLTSNSEFQSSRNYFARYGIGYDFYRRNLKQKDSTRFLSKATHFLNRTKLYLRVEIAVCAQGGVFHERVGSTFNKQSLRYTVGYLENTILLQKSLLKDNLNLHAGVSFMIKWNEQIYGGNFNLKSQKLTRGLDIQPNIGLFFRMPWWVRDFKWGLRYNFGLIDVSNNKSTTNPFYEELNFNRNFALIFKMGL